jgi:hypothetical protein
MLGGMRPEERLMTGLALALALAALALVVVDLWSGGGHPSTLVALGLVIAAQLLNALRFLLAARKRAGRADSPERI